MAAAPALSSKRADSVMLRADGGSQTRYLHERGMFCYLLVRLPREGRGLISPLCAGPSYPAAPAGTCPGPPSLRRPPNCPFVIFPSRELSATNCAVFAG